MARKLKESDKRYRKPKPMALQVSPEQITNNERYTPKARSLKIYRLVHIEGYTQLAVAKHYDLDPSRICQIVRRVDEWVRVRLIMDITEKKIQQIRRLEYIYEQAAKGWRKSLQNAEKKRTKGMSADPEYEDSNLWMSEEELTSEGQSGDPRFLNTMRECLADIRKILGIEEKKPTQVELKGMSQAGVIIMLPDNGRGDVLDLQAKEVPDVRGNVSQEG